MENNQEQLKKLAKVFSVDKIVTVEDIAEVLKGVLAIMNSFKKDNQELNAETKSFVREQITTLEAKHKDITSEMGSVSSAAQKDIDKKLAEVTKLIEKLKKITPKDGIDGMDGRDGKDGLDGKDGKDGSPDDRLQIVKKINTGKKGDLKIEAKQVDGLDKMEKGILDRAISILDQRTQFLINKTNTATGGGYTDLTEFVEQTPWRVFYSDGSGDVTELELGASGTFLKSNGATSAPTFATPAGSGDVSKVGTPVNNQIGVWTGDGTLEGDAALTFDTTTDVLSSGGLLLSGLTASEIVITDASKNLVSAAVATYPSLAELALIKGLTSTSTELNILDGATLTTTELNYVDGVTSAIQTQINTKAPSTAPTFATSITGSYLTASEILITDGSKNIVSAAVATYPSLTELTYVKGVTSAIQTQLNTKAAHATTITIAGTANQITSSAGAQDLSANRTWTLSLPADVLIPTVLTVPNTGLHLLDTNASHDLIIKPGSNITADRTFTITTGDTDMIVDFTAVTDEFVLAYDTSTNTWRGVTPPAAGTPTAITVADEATDTSSFIAFFTAATGDLGPKTNTNMTFNSNTGVATFASTILTTTDINGGTVDGVTIGGASAGAITGTTITANTGFMPDANDGAYLGQAGTAFADLFLAEGGVINWDSGDLTLTQTGNSLTLAGGDLLLGTNKLRIGTADGSAFVDVQGVTTSAQGMRMEGNDAAGLAFTSYVTGDAQLRFIFQSDGKLLWGDGSSVADTNLYRSAANILKTDDTLHVVGSLGATGTRVVKGWFTDLESTNMPTVGGTAILTSLTAPQFTTIELGHATANTLSASSGVLSIEGVVIPTISSTNTLTNKRRTRRLTTTNAPGATPTTNTDNVDIMNFTGVGAAITSMTTNLSGTPVDGDLVEFRFIDDGTARAITWGATFASTTVTLPTTTVISTTLRVGFEWKASSSKWECVFVI